MISREDNLKKTLLDASAMTKERIAHRDEIMERCVKEKLSNSLELYKSELEDTCRYIMIRNPVVITKEMHQARQDTEKETHND